MSRKILITISIVLVLVAVGLAWYYFFVLSAQNQTGNNMTTTSKTFSPFGGTGYSGTTTGFSSTTQSTAPATNANQLNYTQKLRELWNQPTSGSGVLDTKAGTVVRFGDKATGFVYETQLFSPIQNRLSNTTLPLAYSAVWDAKNSSFVAQYLTGDTVSTNVLFLKSGTTTDQTITGFALGTNISSVSVFGETIFYLQTYTGASLGFTSTIDGKTKKQIWKSPLDELTTQMVSANSIALTTKPYQNVPGFTYLINATNGSNKKLLGNIPGLVTLVSPDASKVLYSSQTGTSNMYLFDTKTGGTISITPATFPEKCVWSNKDANIVYCAVPENSLDGTSLTAWYMGQTSFTDDIWKYDLKQNTASIIEHLYADAGEQVDVIKPTLSTSEQYLVFINKTDGTLWSLDLTK